MDNIEQCIAALESELKTLKDELAKPVEQPDPLRVAFEKTKAQCGGCSYWYINENSGAAYAENYSEGYAFKDFCSGNFFVSKEAAEQVLKNRQVHVFLRALAGGFEPDWDDVGQEKYHPQEWIWRCSISSRYPNTVYFREPIQNIKGLVDARFGEGALEQYLKGDII